MIGALVNLFLYFLACAFVGWLVEAVYKSAEERRFVNPGFLHGPLVPVYGFGGAAVLVIGAACSTFPRWVAYVAVMIAPTIVEYLASLVMERIFSTKLWDYSDEPFNLRGRVCLRYSLYWAVLAASARSFAEPAMTGWIRSWPDEARYFACGMGVMYLAADVWISGRLYLNFASALRRIRDAVARKAEALPLSDVIGNRIPVELRRFLKPLKSFPRLRREIMQSLGVLPDHVTDFLKINLPSKLKKAARDRKKGRNHGAR